MPMAGSIESKIANWPAVRPPILRGAAGWEQRGDGVDRTRGIIHDAARPKALRRELVEAHLARDCGHARVHAAGTACVEIKFRAPHAIDAMLSLTEQQTPPARKPLR